MLKVFPQIATYIEIGVRKIAWWAAWFNVVLLLVILIQVLLRYLFSDIAGGSQIMLGELQWHLYSVAVMFGLSYSQIYNSHVRVDALSRKFSKRNRSVIEILGITLLMYPFLLIMFLQGLDYTHSAWRVNESSASPTGLPWRWIIKSVIPIAFLFLFLALTARLLREIASIFGVEPLPQFTERFSKFHTEEENGR